MTVIDAVVDSVRRMMHRTRPAAEGLDLFSTLLLTSTLESTLDHLDDEALACFAGQCFRHVMEKPRDRHVINFTSSDVLGDPVTVVEILDDDMPFVVESVITELHAEGLIPRLVFHPIFKVKRDATGRLLAVVGPGDHKWAEGDQESFIAVLLDPIEEERRQNLTEMLDRVLDDVRDAAGDAEAMHARVAQAAADYDGIRSAMEAASPAATGAGAPSPLELTESAELLRWLTEGNFTLLGARGYELAGSDGTMELRPSAVDALGIARMKASPAATSDLQGLATPGVREAYNSPSPLIFSKSPMTSRVRSHVPLDCIGVKRYTAAGKLVGELRLWGLYTPAFYVQPVAAVPVVRNKVSRVLADAQFPPDSHNGRTLIDILENFPRDEVLQVDQRRLYGWSMKLLDLSVRPRTAVMTRHDDLGGYVSALVFVPREHYSSAQDERIGAYLESRLGGRVAAHYPYISASLLVRTQFIIAGGETGTSISDDDLERGIVELIRSWDERLDLALQRQAGNRRDIGAAFRGAFSAGYAEMFAVDRAVEDIARIARLGPNTPIAIDFYREEGTSPHRVRAAVYRFDQPLSLSERVPLLENMGFKVIDERSYRVHPRLDGAVRVVVLHDMVLEHADGLPIDLHHHDARMEDVFLAVSRGDAESDPFNALVVAAALDWRQAAVLRAFGAYMRQMRAPFSPRYIAETLIRYPGIAADLYALFEARFGSLGHAGTDADSREQAANAIRQRIEDAFAGVQGLDEDRILRRLLNLVLATVRTNAFQIDAAGAPPREIAIKFASREIDRLPDPKPYREIFVYSPRMEGVHLRFAAIARGGIRWSDRAQDYRTEVLGLAKAQQVKNTVIVPTGAKGGFILKQLKRDATREETQAEGVACYRAFIGALLSVTDDIRDGSVVPPAGVVRRDGDDPYLVVAADKGTATFSDYANAIAVERGYWLGDAFASGGSAGYDHKRLGITARGAWECVKRHFREMDIDIQQQPFRVIGVGDMSGDVFGNGMLLSPQIRLVAAFDHRDIFIDPAPDAAATFAERKRLFDLPRSSWADFDRSKISAGGGVFSRTAKSIALSSEIRALLGLDVTETTPAELIQALLRCETDLLWFGGIGTYVRETNESDEQAGDRTNDPLRVTAAELRAKVIGEGANLGLTQRARIEAALHGIRLNADFIDNSAGVNTSDQEVNIKIALAPALASGRLSREDRNHLLVAMSADVASGVLANNHAQGLALSLAQRASKRDLSYFVRLVRHLEERGLIDRKLEALPSGAELGQRASSATGLTRPELAVLMSWAKIALDADLLASAVPDGPEAAGLAAYFPPALRDRYRDDISAHPLRREIVATGITNTIVNSGGPDIMMRLAAVAGDKVPVLAEAYLAARAIHGIDEAWRRIDDCDGRIPGGLQLELYAGLQELCAAEASRLLVDRRERTLMEMTATYGPMAEEIAGDIPGVLPQRRRSGVEKAVRELQDRGVPAAVAWRHAGRTVIGEAMALADRASETGTGLREAARAVFATAEYLSLDEFRARAAAVVPADDFDRQSIAASLAVIERAAHVTGDRMLADPASRGTTIEAWAAENAPDVLTAASVIGKALAEPGLSIARLGVVADALRGVANAGQWLKSSPVSSAPQN